MFAGAPLWFLLLLFVSLGAIWGSFAGALVARWPKGESIVSGRSRCDACDGPIAAFDLVPVVSNLALRGKCRHCGAAIGPAALATELVSALIGAVAILTLPLWQALCVAIFGWLLLPLFLLDYRHLWLPTSLVIIVGLAGFVGGPVLAPDMGMGARIIGASAAFGVLEAIRLLYRKLRHVDGMGAGDPKLFAALGIWLGWELLPVTLLAASGIGLAHALVSGSMRRDAAMPLGSYLAIAAWIVAWTGALAS